MSTKKIRIKLKSYDHSLLDQVVANIVDMATKPMLDFIPII